MTVYLITKDGYGIKAEIVGDDLTTLRERLIRGDVINNLEEGEE